MTQLIKTLTKLLISILFFVGLLFSSPATLNVLAAVTPDAAKQVIKNADSAQEAAQNLKALDSSEILRNHGTLDTTKDVLKTSAQDRVTDRPKGDPLVNEIEEKFKEAAETVKEKLNLDEPIPESTKKFGRQITEKANDIAEEAEKATDTVTGKSRRVVNDIAGKSKTAAQEGGKAIDNASKSGYYNTNR